MIENSDNLFFRIGVKNLEVLFKTGRLIKIYRKYVNI